jgi:tetratricopeptide (TPR) repeat protein
MNAVNRRFRRAITFRPTRVCQFRPFSTGILLLLSGCLLAFFANPVAGQLAGSRSLPKPDYYNIFPTYYSADFKDAAKYFDRESRTAFRMGNERFLDSVCFWTMLGECNYHMGNYAEAVDYYEQGLSLYLAFQRNQWQARVQTPPQILESNTAFQRARISWGAPKRRAAIARMPGTFAMLYGRLDSERAFVEGGPVDNAEIRQVDITEIMRCVALSLHRRRVIKGPTCKFDPFTAELIRGLSVNGAGNGTVLGAFNGILLGIAQASTEDWDRATKTLSRSLQFSGGMDHPLTPV